MRTTSVNSKKQEPTSRFLAVSPQSITWGVAFELVDEMALAYLERRECKLGGYRTLFTTFYPRNGVAPPHPALIYIATADNDHWLGHAPEHEIASQVTSLSQSLSLYTAATFPVASALPKTAISGRPCPGQALRNNCDTTLYWSNRL